MTDKNTNLPQKAGSGTGANQLPKLTDIYEASKNQALSKDNDLVVLLNQDPPKEWLKDHPIATNVKYIPISIVEWLLTYIFTYWYVEILEAKLVANSIQVTVRLFYRDPVSGELKHTDGIGAASLQTNAGAAASDFDKIKSSAVMIAAPMAKTYAIKDAAETLGKLFGKNLNRKEDIDYTHLQGRFEKSDELTVIKKNIKDTLDVYQGTDLEEIREECQTATTLGLFDLNFAMKIAGKLGII